MPGSGRTPPAASGATVLRPSTSSYVAWANPTSYRALGPAWKYGNSGCLMMYCRLHIYRASGVADGGLITHKSKRSPLAFFRLLPGRDPLSSAWIMFRLDSARASTNSGIRPAAINDAVRSESSAATREARSIHLNRISRLMLKPQ